MTCLDLYNNCVCRRLNIHLTNQLIMSSTSSNSIIEIKSNDIIQLILQYLKENKLSKSFQALQQQSGTTLNQLNQTQFVSQFRAKNWPYVIDQLSQLMLSQQYLLINNHHRLFFTTYEFICDALIQDNQFQAVGYLIDEIIRPNIKEMAMFRQRLMRLEYVVEHSDQKSLYKNPPNQQRESSIISQLLQVSIEAPPQRLLHLLTQSLKYQASQGVITPTIKLNLFTGFQHQQKLQPQTLITQTQKTITYTQQSKITTLTLSWSEQYLAIGGIDGLIQLYNPMDYSLYDNEYQMNGEMFFHDFPIHGMQFNYTDQMLASVDTKGVVNVWDLRSGRLLRKIEKEVVVNAICWGVEPAHLVVGYKQTLKLYGIRNCTILKHYTCHNSQFISTIFPSQTSLYSISTNGTVSIFNYATAQLTSTLQTKQNLISCYRLFTDNTGWQFDRFVLGFKKKIVEYDRVGMEMRSYGVEDGELVGAVAKGEYVYECVRGGDGKCRVSVMERGKRKVVFYTGLQSPFQQMLISRKRNLLITYDQTHRLSFWRPT